MDASVKDVNKKAARRKFLKTCLIGFVVMSVFGTACTAAINGQDTETVVLPDPTSYFYIDDYSHVFSAQTEEFLYAQGKALYEATGAQIAVVAVPSTYSESLEDFSLKLARKWGVGDAEKDNGVLILYTTEEAHVRMEVGYGLEGRLNDAKCGRILDNWSVEAMRSGNWNRAAVMTWIETAKEVYAESGLDVPDALSVALEISEDAGGGTPADADMPAPIVEKNDLSLLELLLSSFFVFWIISGPILIIVLICYWAIRFLPAGTGGNRSGGSGWHGGGFSGGSFGGGGGFGGGSFGGGGGFGGGGASR